MGVGVTGNSNDNDGVHGSTQSKGHFGVYGENLNGQPPLFALPGAGVRAVSNSGVGIWASSVSSVGVFAQSTTGMAVSGTTNATDGPAIQGSNDSNGSVAPNSAHGAGVSGSSFNGPGVFGFSMNGAGVLGTSSKYDGVHGICQSSQHAALAGENTANGMGLWARGKPAGRFEGDILVTGSVSAADVVLLNADCAEEFDVVAEEPAEPGTVMILDDEGRLSSSRRAFDKKVAGVISGAGEYRPGVILDRKADTGGRALLALLGKVYCKVDAQFGPIEVGDLLTTSPTLGHAMRAGDPLQAFGAVIGKALRPLREGQGLIPILIALQ